MNVFKFVLPFPALGKESVRAKTKFYIPSKTREYMRQCAGIFREGFDYAPAVGPVLVKVECHFKRPKTVDLDEKWMTRKPDVDNIQKALFDAGSSILWNDDSQIVLSYVKKIWSEEDMVIFELTIL